jgi:(p)ppGpp synthase/HD superfamily hydrolase
MDHESTSKWATSIAIANDALRNERVPLTLTPRLYRSLTLAATVLRLGFDERLAIAGMILDATQSNALARSQAIESFGTELVSIADCVNRWRPNLYASEDQWTESCKRDLFALSGLDESGTSLLLADRLIDVREVSVGLREGGRKFMKRYKITPESIFTYYQTLSEEFLKKQLPGSEEFAGHGGDLEWIFSMKDA